MYISFDQLSPTSKIWIYQAEKAFTAEQVTWLSQELKSFTHNWESHGIPLTSSFQIQDNQFIILGVESNSHEASGCSIDKSVDLIKSFENRLSITLLDRSQVMIKTNNQLQLIPFKQLKERVQDNILTPETLIYNNSIATISELSNDWLKPAKDTWLSKYFNN